MSASLGQTPAGFFVVKKHDMSVRRLDARMAGIVVDVDAGDVVRADMQVVVGGAVCQFLQRRHVDGRRQGAVAVIGVALPLNPAYGALSDVCCP